MFDTVFTASGMNVVKIPPQAPQANAYAERCVATVRAECLDWTLVCNQRHLHRVLTEYLRHYNTVRPHRSLDLHPPRPAPRLTPVEPDGRETSVQRVDVLGTGRPLARFPFLLHGSFSSGLRPEPDVIVSDHHGSPVTMPCMSRLFAARGCRRGTAGRPRGSCVAVAP